MEQEHIARNWRELIRPRGLEVEGADSLDRHTLRGLLPATEYRAQVRARDQLGNVGPAGELVGGFKTGAVTNRPSVPGRR